MYGQALCGDHEVTSGDKSSADMFDEISIKNHSANFTRWQKRLPALAENIVTGDRM